MSRHTDFSCCRFRFLHCGMGRPGDMQPKARRDERFTCNTLERTPFPTMRPIFSVCSKCAPLPRHSGGLVRAFVPLVQEVPYSNRKAISDCWYCTISRMGPGTESPSATSSLSLPSTVCTTESKVTGPCLVTDHLHRESPPNLAIDKASKGRSLGLPFSDRNMPRTVVVPSATTLLPCIVVVHRIVFGERTSGAEGIHDLHGLCVLDFVLASDGNPSCRQQARSQDNRTDRVFLLGTSHALVVT